MTAAVAVLPWLTLLFTAPLACGLFRKKKSNSDKQQAPAENKPKQAAAPTSDTTIIIRPPKAPTPAEQQSWLKKVLACCGKKTTTKNDGEKTVFTEIPNDEPRFYDHWVKMDMTLVRITERGTNGEDIETERMEVNGLEEYEKAPEQHNLDTLLNCGKGERPRMFFDMTADTDPKYHTRNKVEEKCDTLAFSRMRWDSERGGVDDAPRGAAKEAAAKTLTLTLRKKATQGRKPPANVLRQLLLPRKVPSQTAPAQKK